jgi:hypothetical protein
VSIVNNVVVCALVYAGLAGSGCIESNAPLTPQLGGTFALTMVNGKILPDTEIIAPSRFPGQPNCVTLGTSGSLRLDPATSKFLITLNARNSCSTDESVLDTEEGTYSQDGPTLLLLEPLATGAIGKFAGQVDERSIAIRGAFRAYTFAR